MIAYLDSSALLRLILRQPGALDLKKLRSGESIISSELLAVECSRTIDRMRLHGVAVDGGVRSETYRRS